MNESMNILMPFLSLDDRNMAIFIGLYLSRFNQLALDAFDFTGYHQAYNVLGYALNIKPKSINNYRDEFVPYFPNGRKGWNREMKPQSKVIFDLAKDLTFEQFTFIIKAHLSHTEVEWSDIQLPADYYFDSLHSDALLFERHERQIIQTTFIGKFIS